MGHSRNATFEASGQNDEGDNMKEYSGYFVHFDVTKTILCFNSFFFPVVRFKFMISVV